MKVTFPHMGNLAITARAVLEGLGLEVVVPPPCTKRTLSLGVQHAPENACLPFKVNLGNYIEAAELGADTVLMAGGIGPCRLGYYAEIQREILLDLGYRMEMIVLEPPDAHFSEVTDKIKRLARAPWQQGVRGAVLAWKKTCAVDAIEEKIRWIRPREIAFGPADSVYRAALTAIDLAKNAKEVHQAKSAALGELAKLPVDLGRKVARIALVGEIYTVLESFVNHDLERHLGSLGIEVVRFMYLSQWINDHLLAGIIPKRTARHLVPMARPYLGHFVGGHGIETVGGVVACRRLGLDGLIQIGPLTCMPEIVAQSVLSRASHDQGVPVMTIYIDEQSGEAGLQTRLEAFADVIFQKQTLRKLLEKSI